MIKKYIVRKNKAIQQGKGNQECWGESVAILNRVIRLGLIEKVTCEQRLKGSESQTCSFYRKSISRKREQSVQRS